jgi:hypothetical protein
VYGNGISIIYGGYMKKVVINSDFGGFGLSEQAEEWLKNGE